MDVIFSDQEITALIKERKVLPNERRNKFRKTTHRGNDKYRLNVTGEDGNEFQVIVRISVFNKLNFSVILGVKVPPPKKFFRLKRYNGDYHLHTNTIEEQEVTGFHIHTATERYQAKVNSIREEDYAEPTKRYTDLNGALKCLFADANFEDSYALQDTLFEEG
ncbi:MAG: hypothetical protein OXD54_17715 [Candidatus Poribacteria bacterium]|nr:hypothetical protein [Candidatus Poribacteria bacterium]